ncbi:MAG TPA: GntR family transcriptional regulator [Nevskia sp.]|nr:GntR family transcriptional regulator [Nevskia sp.]
MSSVAPFHQIPRQSLSESVYLQLKDKIVRHELAAGSPLPSERELSELLGVNRGAVREAIKRLQQAQLVAVRQGGNHVVLDYLDEGGLELLPSLLVDKRGRMSAAAVRAVMAMRSALAPDIAAAAAERGGARLARQLKARLEQMRAAGDDLPALQEHCFEFWKALVTAGGNIAFRLAFNSMQKTYRQVWDLLTRVMEAEFRDLAGLASIAQAVEDGDPEQARTAGRRHVEIGRRALDRALAAAGGE